MSLAKVVITDFLTEADVEKATLADQASVHLALAHTEEDLIPQIGDADILIVYHDIPMLTDATFAAAPRCRGIVRAGVGYNNIDREAAARRGMVVCNVPDYGSEEVADHAIMLLLAVTRGLIGTDQAIRRGEWDLEPAKAAPRLRGKTLGLVGCGRIGSATALRAKAFGMEVLAYDPYQPDGLDKALGIRRAWTLPELLGQADFVSLNCFLDEASHHLIDAAAFAAMKPGAILINTARGPVVDQEALIDALESGRLAGAGIDVFEREPLDDDRLRRHPRVVLTPHVAFYSVEGYVEMRRKAAIEAGRILRGEAPRNPVNTPIPVGKPQ